MGEPEQGTETATHDGNWGVSRRTFLIGSASALGLGLVGCNGNGNGDTTTTAALPPTTASPPDSSTVTTMAPPNPLAGGNLEAIGETWNQPWVWRPTGEPDDVLNLYVVENLAPIAIAGQNLQNGALEQGVPLLFSWNGLTPGPTIRMGGTDTLLLKIYNQLGQDLGRTTVGPNPDIAAGPYPGLEGTEVNADFKAGKDVFGTGDCLIPADVREDWCLGEHVNGVHTVHVTNIHTHGLHVRPGRNPNGTHSDNIYVRIIPRADARRGIATYGSLEAYIDACFPTDEVEVGEANYEFALGNTERVPVHPPGTHWYHPHSHGSTHMQVAGGMAGFLIVEGDVDEAVNEQLAGVADPDPEVPTGDWDYRERTVLMQVINIAATDPEAPQGVAPRQGNTRFPIVNGSFEPRIIVMRPGAIERWRVLNGSVDGNGYLRAALLKGEYVIKEGQLADAATGGPLVVNDYQPVTTEGGSEDLKAHLWQLAFDGITLVNSDGEYFVKDLGIREDVDLGSADDVYASAENVMACYDRPNEVSLTTGNRTDLFWQAPADDPTPQVYTLVGLPTGLHGGGPQQPFIAAYVVVKGDPVAGAKDFQFNSLTLPDVPSYLSPIADTDPELQVGGGFRTRTVRYAGWGGATFPPLVVPPDFVAANGDLNKLSFYAPPSQLSCNGKTQTNPRQWWPVGDPGATGIPVDETTDLPTVVIPPNVRTMNIDGFKFNPTAVNTPRMELNTVEEWAVFNQSIELYGQSQAPAASPEEIKEGLSAARLEEMKEDGTLSRDFIWYVSDEDSTPQLWFPGHQTTYPVFAADAPDGYAKKVAAVDHPFHIHQNPFWLMTIDVPLADGTLVNVLPEPRWQDVQWIPRNGGRFVFRSRFYDYTGELVNHCHILLHEDNGMMQRIQIGPPWPNPPSAPDQPPQEPNYVVARAVLSPSGDNANSLYPPPTPAESWEQSAEFIDTGRELQDPPGNTGQVFPGFPVTAPELP